MQRRLILKAASAAGGLYAGGGALAQPAGSLGKPLPELKLLVPSKPGGGWDLTARALGTAMQLSQLVEKVQYENVAGKGGTLGLAHFVEHYANSPNTLLMAGMTMLGSIALHRSKYDLSHIEPLASLTSEFQVVAVPAASPIKSVKQLAARLNSPDYKATVVGDTVGGVDHMLSGMILRAMRANTENFSYLAAGSGAEVSRALTESRADWGISGYNEFRSAITNGTIRALAVSSRNGRYGVPSLREGGIPTDVANWRCVFAPKGINEEQTRLLASLVERVTRSKEWAELVRRNDWQASYRSGRDFREFLDTEQTMARVVVHLLKLKS